MNMGDGVLPPFGDATGPLVGDAEVVTAFLRGDTAGHSELLHVEGSVLVAGFDLPLVMRIGPDTVLVRGAIPVYAGDATRLVEDVLESEGLTLLDEETLLATAVAVQWLAERASTWDLWGRDIDEAFARLRETAVSDPFGTPITE